MKVIQTKILKKYHNPFQYKDMKSHVYYDIKNKTYVLGLIIEMEESMEQLEELLIEEDILLIDSFIDNSQQIIEVEASSIESFSKYIKS